MVNKHWGVGRIGGINKYRRGMFIWHSTVNILLNIGNNLGLSSVKNIKIYVVITVILPVVYKKLLNYASHLTIPFLIMTITYK